MKSQRKNNGIKLSKINPGRLKLQMPPGRSAYLAVVGVENTVKDPMSVKSKRLRKP
jgi:hypothetical protein